jgi:hypothetical protein
MADTVEPAAEITAMAFQLILARLHTLEEAFDTRMLAQEQALGQIVPLLAKMVTHLEAQAAPSAVPVATFAQIYPELQEAEPEQTPSDADAVSVEPPVVRGRLRQWLTKEVPGGK